MELTIDLTFLPSIWERERVEKVRIGYEVFSQQTLTFSKSIEWLNKSVKYVQS